MPLTAIFSLTGLLAGAAPADAPILTRARLSPGGAAGLTVLMNGDRADPQQVSAEVSQQGFYAGEPLGAGDCATCHVEIAAQWARSAHRFASFNNPYYAVSVELFRKERGAPASRFCAGCHDPLLLVDDRMAREPLSRDTPAAQAGLPCLICHSIRGCDGTYGNGGYRLDASPVPPPRSGEAAAESSGPSPHGQRLRPELLGQPALCATCHKVGLMPEVTADVWLRGQNDYDAWQSSMAGGNGVSAVYRPVGDPARGGRLEVKRCQDCHMPLERTASGQMVRSHRFLAANAALPNLRGDTETTSRTAEFLRGAVSLDLVVVREPDRTGDSAPPPSLDAQLTVRPDERLFLDVVLRNRRVGHRFPSGTNDSNEVFVEVAVTDAADRRRGELRDTTHLVRAQPVDEHAEPLRKRDPQHMRGVVYDTSLSPSDPQVVRYLVDLSQLPGVRPGRTLQVQAALRYRKFSREYARLACAALPATVDRATRARCEDPPLLTLGSAERTLVVTMDRGAARNTTLRDGSGEAPLVGVPAEAAPRWQRLLDHGLGLSDGLVDQASAARPSLELAASLAPDRPEPQLGLARLALALGRTDDVLHHGGRAEALRPDHPAAYYLRAMALYRTYRWTAARPFAERAAELVPTDRNALTLLSRVRGLTGDPAAALAAADRLLAVDAEAEDGHHQRMLALRELGRAADLKQADEAEQRYLYYRRPVERDQELRQRFRALYPERTNEDVPAHVHTLRPVEPTKNAAAKN